MGDPLEQWERASAPTDRVSPPHGRRTAAPPTPSARVIELTRMLEQERQFLAEACAEIRTLRRAKTARSRGNAFRYVVLLLLIVAVVVDTAGVLVWLLT